ncbi:hypothetical protein MTR_3g098700 [Medicago truncatula]|uniref:Uncharacterized protein n=1 Tax=Medicago truncatula TaxID=3880 RepID=G7J3A7_MEDTR|nr:hypothetical protein MTR_3g098700 [Medicago truncatula]
MSSKPRMTCLAKNHYMGPDEYVPCLVFRQAGYPRLFDCLLSYMLDLHSSHIISRKMFLVVYMFLF